MVPWNFIGFGFRYVDIPSISTWKPSPLLAFQSRGKTLQIKAAETCESVQLSTILETHAHVYQS
jgi:hypothetical protein